jgi:hypothetical protein
MIFILIALGQAFSFGRKVRLSTYKHVLAKVSDAAFFSEKQRHTLIRKITQLTGVYENQLFTNQRINEDQLVQIILARPWRRSAVDPATLFDIKSKVCKAVSGGLPIEFSVPFGGYKSWRLASAPHLDWAEVFWIDYLIQFSKRIEKVYPPGVTLSFTYFSGLMEWVNHLPPQAQNTYISELQYLFKLRSTDTLRLHLVDHTHAYGGPDIVIKLIEDRMAKIPAPSESDLMSAKRNLNTEADGFASQEMSSVAIEQAARRCLAMMSLELRKDFNKYGPRIQLTHIKGASLSLHLGSCRSAVAQPWVTTGYLAWNSVSESWLEKLATHTLQMKETQSITIEHALQGVSPKLNSILVNLN